MGPSIGTRTPSVYSHSLAHTGTRSVGTTTGLRSTRSVRSLRTPWYKEPLVTSCFGLNVQRLSLYTAFYSFFVSVFTIATSAFDIYCLSEATPGSKHYGYYLISFDFVYVGNKHVRNSLFAIAILSMVGGVALLVTTLQLVQALRNEHEKEMTPWLVCMMVFMVWRFFGFTFAAIVNDMIFTYNVVMCLMWVGLTVLNALGWASVYSLFLELCDLTRLEDFAHLRMGTMASLAGTQSMAGSRPVTPHSYSTSPTMQIP